MSTHTDEKRYLSDLTIALRLRKISGARIGDILAEVETHTAESGQNPREAFGEPKEYAKQFEVTPEESAGRRFGPAAWIGVITAALGAFLLTDGAFAAMAGEDVFGVPGWWATAAGAAILLVTFSLVPVDAIIDPRRPNAERYGRKFLVGWVAVAIVVVVLAVVALMSVIG